MSECEKCFAPLLFDRMVLHVNKVSAQPHLLILFDYDTYQVKDVFKAKIDDLLTNDFDRKQDKILLIGRASKTGDQTHNVALSGKCADKVKDYVIDTFRIRIEETRIRFLYFGYDPPQLTLEYAKKYGVSKSEFVSVDTALSFKNSDLNQINQSDLAVICRDQDHVAAKQS